MGADFSSPGPPPLSYQSELSSALLTPDKPPPHPLTGQVSFSFLVPHILPSSPPSLLLFLFSPPPPSSALRYQPQDVLTPLPMVLHSPSSHRVYRATHSWGAALS